MVFGREISCFIRDKFMLDERDEYDMIEWLTTISMTNHVTNNYIGVKSCTFMIDETRTKMSYSYFQRQNMSNLS